MLLAIDINNLTLKQIVIFVYGVYLILLSIITFFTYLSDKQKAKNSKWRIPEAVLLGMSFFGGAFGGYLAMLLFRHKTKAEHWYFTAINLLGLVIHIALIICLLFVFNF